MLTVPADLVATAIAGHWPVVARGLRLKALPAGATSQVWLVLTDERHYVAKLCFDTRRVFEIGLSAAEHVERTTEIATVAPIRTYDGDLSVLISTFPDQEHPLALLTYVAGQQADFDAQTAAEPLARIHGALRSLPLIGHDPLGYLIDESGDYAYQDTIRPVLQTMAATVRSADLTWGTCYGDGPEVVRQATGEIGLLDWGGVLSGPVLWDVAEWMQSRGPDFSQKFRARLVDLGFVTEREMAMLQLVTRVRAARELRFRAYRLARPATTALPRPTVRGCRSSQPNSASHWSIRDRAPTSAAAGDGRRLARHRQVDAGGIAGREPPDRGHRR